MIQKGDLSISVCILHFGGFRSKLISMAGQCHILDYVVDLENMAIARYEDEELVHNCIYTGVKWNFPAEHSCPTKMSDCIGSIEFTYQAMDIVPVEHQPEREPDFSKIKFI